MGRAHRLKSLMVNEISLVDAPANPGAVHLLFKRKDPVMPTEPELVEAYLKREFSAEQRRDLAGSGKALPDGSFPIENISDLHNAIKAVGRASDPEKAKAHIKARAKALGATASLPDTWKAQDLSTLDRLLTRLGLIKRAPDEPTIDPDTYSDNAATAIDTACAALSKSIGSILSDDKVADKPGEIAKQLAAFRAHTADATAAQIEKAMRDVALIAKQGKDDSMPTAEEAIAALTKSLPELIALEVAKATMSDKHKKFMAKLGSQDAKDKFAAKSADDREAQCNAAADDDDDMGKRGGDTSVALAKAQGEIDTLKKSIAVFEAERELQAFQKRAAEIGIAETQAEVLLKASKGDGSAFDQLLAMMKSATAAARTGGIFKEFGSALGGAGEGSAGAEVQAKAEALMKSDPNLSIVNARIAVRKQDAALAQREREEERARVRAVT